MNEIFFINNGSMQGVIIGDYARQVNYFIHLPEPKPKLPPQGTTFFAYRGHTTQFITLAWSPDGTRIASAGLDNTVQIWSAADGKNILTYQNRDVFSALSGFPAWSPDSKYVVFSTGKSIELLNTISGMHGVLVNQTGFAQWSSSGQYIAYALSDQVIVYDVTIGREVYIHAYPKPTIWNAKEAGVRMIAWAPNEQYIAAAVGRSVQVRETATGEEVGGYCGHKGRVHTLAWSPDGTRVLSAALQDEAVLVWQPIGGGLVSLMFELINSVISDSWDDHVVTYTGHSSGVLSASWSPDSTRIASSGYDHTVQVWDAGSGKALFTYKQEDRMQRTGGWLPDVVSVIWSPDGKRIASASQNTVRVWQAP